MAKLPQFKTAYNAHLYPKKYEVNNKPSETVPDQAISVRELFARFSSGLPLTGQKVPIYDGDEQIIPDPKTLDLTDMQEMKENTANTIKELKSRLQKSLADKKSNQSTTVLETIPPEVDSEPKA